MTGTLLKGTKQVATWDTADAASVEATREAFNAIVTGGATALDPKGDKVTTFDPSVEVITVVSPFAGG